MEKIGKDGRGNREGLFRFVHCQSFSAFQDEVERPVLGRRGDSRSDEPHRKEAYDVGGDRKVNDVRQRAELLEGFPLRRNSLDRIRCPRMLLDESHLRGKSL